ncbi:hypothetical protein GQ649_03930 [Rhodococcus sp. DSM 6344]|nr:hypothetical protein [Rhodococcus erythropolis]
MTNVKREATENLAIRDKAVGGFGGGFIKIRHYESSPEIDLELSKLALVLAPAEAIMVAKALLAAAQPDEQDFWPDVGESDD